jgi:hypothetical protein
MDIKASTGTWIENQCFLLICMFVVSALGIAFGYQWIKSWKHKTKKS